MEKLYYTISEVATMFNVAPTLIRFWEREFDIIKPHRNKKGNRQFTSEDIETFRLIYNLVKVKKLTLEGAKQEIKNNLATRRNNLDVIERLKTIKQELLEIKKEIVNENI